MRGLSKIKINLQKDETPKGNDINPIQKYQYTNTKTIEIYQIHSQPKHSKFKKPRSMWASRCTGFGPINGPVHAMNALDKCDKGRGIFDSHHGKSLKASSVGVGSV